MADRRRLAGCGHPLHPAGRPERLRTAHWPLLGVPTLFVQGDRDGLCDLDLLERERRRLPAAAASRRRRIGPASWGAR